MKTTQRGAPKFPSFTKAPTDYAGLCAPHFPRRIRTEAEAGVAARIVEALTGHDLSARQDDYLAVFG